MAGERLPAHLALGDVHYFSADVSTEILVAAID